MPRTNSAAAPSARLKFGALRRRGGRESGDGFGIGEEGPYALDHQPLKIARRQALP